MRTISKVRIGFLLLLLLPGMAQAVPVARLLVERNSETVATGTLTLVAEDMAVASHALVQLGDRWLAEDHTGARILGEIVGEFPEQDLVLFEVRGLRGEPVTLARELPERGRTVSTLDAGQQASRGILSASPADDAAHFEHTALYAGDAHGAPVFNNCGELIGLGKTTLIGILNRRPAEPALPLRATALDTLRGFLEEHDIAPSASGEQCLSLEAQLEQARTRTDQTDEERRELERLMEEIRQRNEELERTQEEIRASLAEQEEELTHTREEKEELEALAETIREESDALRERRAELERAKREQEERFAEEQARKERQQQWLLGGIAGLLAVLLVGLVALRRRKQQLELEAGKADRIEQELSAATATFPDLVLTGTDADGQSIRVKINGDALIRSAEGQILGRDAKSADHVLSLPEISRQHLRLIVRDGEVRVTDLNAYNGTMINGTALTPGREYVLTQGDTLALGPVELQVHVLKE